MTDEPSWPGVTGPPGQEGGQEQVTPWFPPSSSAREASPEGVGQPGAWQPPSGHAQPGPGQSGLVPPPGRHIPPGGWGPPPPGSPPGGWGPPPPGTHRQPSYGGWPPSAAKPGLIPLRPLAVGEILDGAFTSVRHNPKATLGLAAIVLTATGVISTGLLYLISHLLGQITPLAPGQSPAQVVGTLGQMLTVTVPAELVSLLIAFAADVVLTGLLTTVVGRNVLGQVITAGQAWRLARSRLPAVLLVLLLTLVAALVVPALVVVAAVGVAALLGAPAAVLLGLAVLLGFAALCLAIWVGVTLKLTVPAVMLEHQGPLGAMARSWRLVRGSFWRVFGIALLTRLIITVAGGMLQIPFLVVSAALGGPASFTSGSTLAMAAGFSVLPLLINAVGGVVAGTVTRPVGASVTVLLYVDLRIRREGFDLVLQHAAGGATDGGEFASLWRPGAAATPPAPRPSQPDGSAGPRPPAPGEPSAW